MHARDMADLKAVSQNLMHGNVGVTDGIYAILSDQDRRERIRGLGSGQEDGSEIPASSTRLSSPKSVESQRNGGELADHIAQLEMLLARLKAKA